VKSVDVHFGFDPGGRVRLELRSDIEIVMSVLRLKKLGHLNEVRT